MTGDDALADAVKEDYTKAGLDEKTRVLMDFAVQVTRDPHAVGREGVQALRVRGWTDEEILLATHIIGFFNYYTRMVDALGVEPEPDWAGG